MKELEHIREAKVIGDDSYALTNYEALRKRSSRAEQIQALRKDKQWQIDHHNEVMTQIDALIQDIKGETE